MHNYNPPELNFVDSTLSVEERYHAIKNMLTDYECVVTFTKVDGDTREMPCTLKEDAMPVSTQVIKEDIADIPNNFNVITVWCTDKQAWRAMRTMNVTNVKLPTKNWIVTIEEDPETGDAILPFPPEMLKQVGWKEGDELDWIDNSDGTWSIQKKK
jgi:hypothetical protein